MYVCLDIEYNCNRINDEQLIFKKNYIIYYNNLFWYRTSERRGKRFKISYQIYNNVINAILV